jgi:hypothetical protein
MQRDQTLRSTVLMSTNRAGWMRALAAKPRAL